MPPDSKLVAIEALGNVCLATEYHFHQYLNQVMECFKSASMCSMETTSDEDQSATLIKLRAALVDGYISILHGMHAEEDSYQKTASNPQIEAYAK